MTKYEKLEAEVMARVRACESIPPVMAGDLLAAFNAVSADLRHERNAGWMPIETAPKDGTYVLLSSPDDGEKRPWIGRWLDDAEYPDGGA